MARTRRTNCFATPASRDHHRTPGLVVEAPQGAAHAEKDACGAEVTELEPGGYGINISINININI